MGQDDVVSFSSVIATMFLSSEVVSSLDISRLMAKLSFMGIYVVDEDYDENIDYLFSIIEMDSNCNFRLKEEFSYDSLINGISVRDILVNLSSNMIRGIIGDKSEEIVVEKVKKKVKHRNFVFGLF